MPAPLSRKGTQPLPPGRRTGWSLLLLAFLATACGPSGDSGQPPAAATVGTTAPTPAPTTTAAATGDSPAGPVSQASVSPGFAGSASCQECHQEIHAEWAKSSHATTVRPAEFSDEEQVESFIECSDMFFNQVLGDRHHVRFLLEDGDADWGAGRWLALPCGWDVHEKEVTLHHPDDWQDLPFESGCAACHVTGFRAQDHGFLEFGVGCEECHGPGQEHVNTEMFDDVYSFADRSAAEEVTVCASCHLQGGLSRSTGLKLPPHYQPGGSLFDDYEFDWSQLEQDGGALVLDAHQKLIIQAATQGGDGELRCTSCHSLHGLKHEKHQDLPKQDFCLLCHEDDFSLKEYSQSCNVCEF